MYFSEVDVRANRIPQHIQSVEDISSGYSSGEGLYAAAAQANTKAQPREGLVRSGSLTRSRTGRVTRSTVPKKNAGSDESDDNEVFDTNIIFLNDRARSIRKLQPNDTGSSSETEFFDSVDHLHDSSQNQFRNSILNACQQLQDDKVQLELTRDETMEEVNRGGKYNKKAAPKPPSEGPIKATLVLKPGVVKNVSECKEIFISSPKAKRKSVRRSPSSASTTSSTRHKLDPLTNLLKIPKKMHFWNKRLSWHNVDAKPILSVESRIKSKSDCDLSSRKDVCLYGSEMSIKKLTESPLAHRRIKVIRRFVD